MRELWIVLPLNPEPWRIGPLSVMRRGGKNIPIVGRDQQLDAYKNAVAEQVREKLGLNDGDELVYAPMTKLKVTIFLWRDRAEYTTPQSRTHRKHEADATNMLKATEDALQDVLFKNDRDNRDVRSVIVEQDPDVIPRIVIHVEEWEGLDPDEIPAHVWAKIDAQGQTQFDFDRIG